MDDKVHSDSLRLAEALTLQKHPTPTKHFDAIKNILV